MSKINMTMSGGNSALDMNMNPKQSGTGGTSDYRDLDNKPSINNVELVGDKTAKDLGLVDEVTYKALEKIVEQKVNDILVGGVSAKGEDGNVNIPVGGYNQLGLLKVYKSDIESGLALNNGNGLSLVNFTNHIDTRKYNLAITNKLLDYAVKSALCDGKGAEWTNPEKAMARNRIGAGEWRYIGKLEASEDVSKLTLSLDEDGNTFSLRKIRVLFINYPNSINSTAWVDILINDNSTIRQNWFSKGVSSPDTRFIADSELEVFGNRIKSNAYFRSMNSKTSSHLMIPSTSGNYPYNFDNSLIDGFITEVSLFSYQNAIGSGAYFEVWGVDA